MSHIEFLEESFKKLMNSPFYASPEYVVEVNLKLLNDLGLLGNEEDDLDGSALNNSYQSFETENRLTLCNEKYVIWIYSQKVNGSLATYAWISKTQSNGDLELEMGFVASGVYNSSRLVLRLLDRFLMEIEETNKLLDTLQLGVR